MHRLFLIIIMAGCFLAAAESFSEPIRILFVGNSLTFMPDVTNQHPVTPAFVKALLDSRGISNDIDVITAGGHTFENHWKEQRFQRALERKHYDYILLQGLSIEAMELPPCFRKLRPPGGGDGPEGREHFLEYGTAMIQLARAKHSVPIVIEPWIYDSDHPWLQKDFECRNFPGTQVTWFGGSLANYQKLLDEGYADLRKLTQVEILRVGSLWQILRENHNPDLPISTMYLSDHYHPTYLGAYLSALLISERLSNLAADQFHFCPEQVNPKQETVLKKLALQYLTTMASSTSLK
jgi:hypothetical protein